VHKLKRSNFRKRTFKFKIKLLVFTKNLAKQLILDARAFSSSMTLKEKPSGDRSSLTSESELEMFLKDLPMRQRPVKSPCLCLTFSSSYEL
jgi:hypothetical protein